MSNSSSYLKQLSGKEAWKSTSKRWNGGNNNTHNGGGDGGAGGGGCERSWKQVYGREMKKKRVMVVVDQTSHSKHAMMWALTHVTNKGDFLTLLHIIPESSSESSSSSSSIDFAKSLGSLCKASKPEVEIEALEIQGPKLDSVLTQVKKLEVSVLVLGQNRASSLLNCFCGLSKTEEFVEDCIKKAECLTIGVRKQSQNMGGYLISTRWQKNFWLLA